MLRPEEEVLSLAPGESPDPKLVLLGRMLDPALTADNPLWRDDPVPALRALQKMLIAHALTLPSDARDATLAALRVVEHAVRLRLRWQQMQRSAAEDAAEPAAARAASPVQRTEGDGDATQAAA